MSVYVPGSNIIHRTAISISHFLYYIDNLFYKFKNRKLNYEDIIRVEYNYITTPEFIFENMCFDKNRQSKKDFDYFINVMKKNEILKWKKHYFANFEYCDGCSWNIRVTFKNGHYIDIEGDITFPKDFEKVYKDFGKYIITSDDEELIKAVIEKRFK